MPKVLHVGQFGIHLTQPEPTADRVNDMRLNSKRVGELVGFLNERIVEKTVGGTSSPTVTWREVIGVQSFIYGELYVYAEGLPENACAAAISAVQSVCNQFHCTMKFDQLHKF